jgi:hypothetical protein
VKTIQVVFLDFDGVLNGSQHLANVDLDAWGTQDHDDSMLDWSAIRRLNSIVDKTGALIVVSSMWRIRRSRMELQELLTRNGFTGTVLDKTPYLKTSRGIEVKTWLESTRRNIGSFVILDDNDDFEKFGRDRLVLTSLQDGGLLDEHVAQAQEILALPWAREPAQQTGIVRGGGAP